ncbi:hypothetical protein TSAR_011688 [Trichomalopsis sarcophagae]|uniref:Uncharacterized protein n=1 Tax=Trichomalopsis sarcophagae TaxID=543379 RepID=A0A232EKN0_9HYME|nr:hypothetical protein TSAR_011688 [Trichomalopsis sarcophagae]
MVKMSKLESVIIICVAIAYLSLEISVTEPVAFTRQWASDYTDYKPYVVKVKDQIIVVGLSNNSVILTSVDGVEINTCNFSLSSPDEIAKPVARPVALDNGKLVVGTIMRSSDYNKDLKDDEVHARELNVSDVVVPESPRRFNDQAEPVPLDHHFGPQTAIWGFHIESIKPYDASEGYICTLVNRTDNTMKLKLLDSKFQLVKETQVEPWAHVMSARFGKVSLCYLTANFVIQTSSNGSEETIKKLTTTCDFYDVKDLSHRGSVRSFKPYSAYNESEVGIVNLSDGSAVAVLAFGDNTLVKVTGYTTKYYLQRFNVDGSKGEAVHVGTNTNHFYLMKEVLLDGGAEVCLIVMGEKAPSTSVKSYRIEVSDKKLKLTMSKRNFAFAFVIFCAIIIYINIQFKSGEKVSFSKQWITEYLTAKPNVVAIKDRIFYVDLGEGSVHLRNIDGVEMDTCNITLPTDWSVAHHKSIALGNGKIIIATELTNRLESSKKSYSDFFIVVDSLNCSGTKTLTVNASESYEGEKWDYRLVDVVPYHDSFDIFYLKYNKRMDETGGEMITTPLRFNDEAERIHVYHNFKVETNPIHFHIQTVKPFDPSDGYVYTLIQDAKDHSYSVQKLLRRLDSSFQLIEETEIKPSAFKNELAMSVSQDNVSLCYVNHASVDSEGAWTFKTPTVMCNFFDVEDLKPRATVSLQAPKFRIEERKLEVVSLPDGGAVVALAFQLYTKFGDPADKGYTTKYYLQRINADGSVEERVHVGTYTDISNEMSLVSLGGGEVCLIVVSHLQRPIYRTMRIRSMISGTCLHVRTKKRSGLW